MKKQELFQEYQKLLDQGKAVENVILYIHMPTGEDEVIVNPNVAAKMEYIDKTYNDDLVHTNSKEIYITDAIFCEASEGMDIGAVISELKDGAKAYRKGWNGKGMWIELCNPSPEFTDEKGVTYGRRPYIYMKTADDCLVPWVASQTDLLAEDWEIIEENDDEEEAGDEADEADSEKGREEE